MFARRTQWDLKPNRFTLALDRIRGKGRQLIDLTASNPTQCGFEYETDAILAALARPNSLQYAPEAQGMKPAREAVARYYAELPKGVPVSVDDIFLTTSTSEAYTYAFRLLCDAEDEVLVPAPGYPLFDFLANIQDVRLRHYPLVYDHGWQIDLHALRQSITRRTRAIVVVHPNNPTGSFVSSGERAELAEICRTHQLAIIADEVFLDYAWKEPAVSFAANSECLTFTLSGLSKVSGLPQMKASWMVVTGSRDEKAAAKSRLEVIADTYLSMNTPVQTAMPELLQTRHRFQEQLKARLATNLGVLDELAKGAPQVRRLESDAGWYATLRVPVTGSDEELAIKLMEQQGVLDHPGHFFDFPADGYLVVSLMTPEAEFREGVRRIFAALA